MAKYMRLFLIILLILAIAGLGLFFGYKGGYLGQNSPQNQVNTEESQVEIGSLPNLPQGEAGLKKQVKVDLEQQKVFLFENGDFVREYAISSGLPGTPTPTGKFRVIHKQDMVYSKIGIPSGSCWLPFWVGFTMDGKYGFHEVPICEGKRVGIKEIGKPASVGCIRLKLGDAEEFYRWAEIETQVEIY